MILDKSNIEKGLITQRQYINQKDFKISPEEKAIFVGTVLGDASLNTQNKGKTYRVKFSVSAKKKEYADLLYKKLGRWILTPPYESTRQNANGNSVTSLTFQTFAHTELNFLADIFLKNKQKKSIPPNLVQDHLTPEGFAFWFSDDGGKMDFTKNQGKGIHLYTHCFTESEVQILVNGLKEKFNLDCWIKTNKKSPIIAISGKCFETVVDLIDPYLCDCMREKLPSPRNLNTLCSNNGRSRKSTNKVDDIV